MEQSIGMKIEFYSLQMLPYFTWTFYALYAELS